MPLPHAKPRALALILSMPLAVMLGIAAPVDAGTGTITKKKRVCQKVMSHGQITNHCRMIDTLAGTDCKHPFKVYYFFAGPGVRGAKKYGTFKLDMGYEGPPDYGRTPTVSWRRTGGAVCKIEIKQDDQPLWTSTAQRGSHTLVHIPEKQNNSSSVPNDIRSIVLWVRKAKK